MPADPSSGFASAVVYASNALAKGWSTAKTLAEMALRFVGISDASRAMAIATAQGGVEHNRPAAPLELFEAPGLSEITDSPVAEIGYVRVKIVVTFPMGEGDEDQIRTRIFDIPETDWPDSLFPAISDWLREKLRDSDALRGSVDEPQVKIGYIYRGE